MDVEEPRQHLGVREAAKRLGVHENTVRNWAKKGILPSARLPGSRFYRFDVRDVERLSRRKADPMASLKEERRAIGPELANAAQLDAWASTRDAQAHFPELMRRLLAATPGVSDISIRAGDAISAPGWDGRARSKGTAFLPSGLLCFEFSADQSPKSKANADYEKRRKDSVGIDPAESVFIFATPRRWRGAAAWESERQAEELFAGVRVLDADALEAWLQATPAVHHWISERLGHKPRDAETLESWWERFAASTNPSLPAPLFLAGREQERQRLVDFLLQPPERIAIQAVWQDEAIAFVYATIASIEQDDLRVSQPPVLVRSPEVWSRVLAQPGRMTLMAVFERPDLAAALEQGHHVILPVGSEETVGESDIALAPLHRRKAAEILEAAEVDHDRADRLATLARRSMPSLIRRLARDPTFARPPWARPPGSATVAPLVLVGSWTTAPGDVQVVSKVAGADWPELERELLEWARHEDRPFVMNSGQWRLASPEEAITVLHEVLTSADLERWHDQTMEILTEVDPKVDLPSEERLIAGAKGVSRTRSEVLRRGLAQGLALLGSLESERMSTGLTGAEHARRTAAALLDRAAADESGVTWRSLSDVLPLIAEGAPDVFVNAVHADLDGAEPLLVTMFQDDDPGSGLYRSSAHTGLLWALETLCWSEEHLIEAARALARLHVVDPGGRLSNRPLESLKSVFVGWIRNTAASLDVRKDALDSICRQVPIAGWDLVLEVLPSHHASSIPPHTPRFRDWRPQRREVLISEWAHYTKHLVQLALELVEADPARWTSVIPRLSSLPLSERNQVIEALDTLTRSRALDPTDQLAIWDELRRETARHRQYATAEWAMEAATLDRLESVASNLEPHSAVERFAYLFDWHPDLPDLDLHDQPAFDPKLQDTRTQVVKDVLDTGDIEGLGRLAERSPVPAHLGDVIASIATDDAVAILLEWLDASSESLRATAAAWARSRLIGAGVAWLKWSLGRVELASPARRIALVRLVPAKRALWDAIEGLDPDLAKVYWEQAQVGLVDSEDLERAVQELIRRDRSWAALDAVATALHANPSAGTVTTSLVEQVLRAAIDADPRTSRMQALGYQVGRLINFLDAGGYSLDTLAYLESAFFSLLENCRPPRALTKVLRRSPNLFVELVNRVYRARNEPQRQLDNRSEALARHAWEILRSWRDLPGVREDGTVDAEHLRQWVRDARLALAEADRPDVGDEELGQLLANSPEGTDGVRPAEAIRDILEEIGSQDLETGLYIGLLNRRGPTVRDLYEGGKQERALARQYRESATLTAKEWPRTTRVLRALAERYERDARREDARAAALADTD